MEVVRRFVKPNNGVDRGQRDPGTTRLDPIQNAELQLDRIKFDRMLSSTS